MAGTVWDYQKKITKKKGERPTQRTDWPPVNKNPSHREQRTTTGPTMPSGGQRGRSGTTTEKIADFLARKVGCHNFPPTAGGPKQRCGRHSHSTKRFGGGSTNRRRRHTPPPTSLCRSSTLNETRQRAPPFRVSVYPPEPNQAFNGAPTTLAAPSIGNRAKASTATRQPKSNNKKKMGSDSAANPSPAPAPPCLVSIGAYLKPACRRSGQERRK